MNKLVYLIIFISLLTSVLLAAEPIAYLMKSKGDVKIFRNEKIIKFNNGDPLFNNDQIKTEAESYAAIKYLDGGATLKVFPNSIIKITAKKEGKELNKSTLLDKGSLYSTVNSKIKGIYQVESPNTVASVKGTGFLTKWTVDQKTIIIVTEGEVQIQNKESGKKTSTKAGNTCISDAKGSMEERPSLADDLSAQERQEIEATNQEAKKTMKVQVIDENGNIKYIEITY